MPSEIPMNSTDQKSPEELSVVEWLITEEAAEYLLETVSLLSRFDATSTLKSLRKSLPLDRAAVLLELAQLRIRARRKFSRADKMFFTQRSYEQSSSETISHYKANLIPDGTVTDICVGAGGDLIALAEKHTTIGLEMDSTLVRYAQANLKAYDRTGEVLQDCFSKSTPVRTDFWHLDPDRRTEQGRTTHVSQFSPDLETIVDLLVRHPHGCLKLAPATQFEVSLRTPFAREWIGAEGETKQQLFWSGKLAESKAPLTITIVNSNGSHHSCSITKEITYLPPVEFDEENLGYLIEPHPVIRSAKSTLGFFENWNSLPLDSLGNWGWSEKEFSTPFSSTFRLLRVARYDSKRLQNALSDLDCSEVEVKTIGLHREHEKQLKKLKLSGATRRTLFYFLRGKSLHFAIGDRISSYEGR